MRASACASKLLSARLYIATVAYQTISRASQTQNGGEKHDAHLHRRAVSGTCTQSRLLNSRCDEIILTISQEPYGHNAVTVTGSQQQICGGTGGYHGQIKAQKREKTTNMPDLTLFDGRSDAPTTALMKVLLPARFSTQRINGVLLQIRLAVHRTPAMHRSRPIAALWPVNWYTRT